MTFFSNLNQFNQGVYDQAIDNQGLYNQGLSLSKEREGINHLIEWNL